MNQIKLDILKTEFLLTQQQMDKYDQLSMTVKAWAVTSWVASSGWALQSAKKEILLLGMVLVITFWFFDGINKTFRTHYKNRRDQIAVALRETTEKDTNPNIQTPQLPPYSLQGIIGNVFTPHISLPYISFIIISLVLFLI